MKRISLNKAFRSLCMAVMTLSATGAFAAIPLAGIYEMNDKADGSKHQMYLELDFINSRPDFTQTFTTKRSEFKLLPSDFMRAKKLSREFKGTTAPGFGKYRHHMLFSSSEEFRITNPRLKKGIILVDWENTLGNKGEGIIIPQPDGSLVTYGLTTFDRLIGPDGHKLTLVKSLLPDKDNGGNNDKPDKEKPETITADGGLVQEIVTICTYPGGVSDAIKRLKEIPDSDSTDGTPAPGNVAPAAVPEPVASAEPQGSEKRPATAPVSEDKKDDTFNTFVREGIWRASSTLAKLGMGKNGIMTAAAKFSDGGNGTVVMNMSQEIAPGDCHVYSFEYIYYGKTVGNTVVFDRITITKRAGTPVPNAKPQPIPKNEPNVIKLLTPTSFDFNGLKFHRTN